MSSFPVAGELIADGRYKVAKMVGQGSYGAVFEAERLCDRKRVAVKCESLAIEKKGLVMDVCVLRAVEKIKSPHFCSLLDNGSVDGRFSFVIMDLVGKSLRDLLCVADEGKFTIGTSLKMAMQSLTSIEELHRIGFLHRDIKPANFAIGHENRHVLFILDFGLSRQFAKVEMNQDVRKPRESAPFRGTVRYASVAAMKEVEQSRKDDLESWLYMVVEWTAGQLPWKKHEADNRAQVLSMKKDLLNPDGKALTTFLMDCPKREFTRILKYVAELTYFSIPDYHFIYEVLLYGFKGNGIKWEDPIDWDDDMPYNGPRQPPGSEDVDNCTGKEKTAEQKL